MRTHQSKIRSKRKSRRPITSSSSSGTSTATIQRYYQRFCKLYRHPFGRRTSPYRKRARKWLRTLNKGDEFYECKQCHDSRWRCDQDELRCQSCVDRHACCSRTTHFRKTVVMEELGLTEDQFRELEEYIPNRRGRKRVVETSSEEDNSEDESESKDDSDDEMVDELVGDDSEASGPVSSSSKAVRGKGPVTRSRKSARRRNSRYSTTPPSQLRPNGHVRSGSLPTSTDVLTSTSSTIQHNERFWKELASIHSRLLDSIGEVIKAVLAAPREAENKGEEAVTGSPSEVVPVSHHFLTEPTSTQPHELQMVVETVSPGEVPGTLSAQTQTQIDSSDIARASHQSITPNDTQPIPLDNISTTDFDPRSSSDTANLPLVGNGEQNALPMELPDAAGDITSTPPGVLPSIETIDLTLLSDNHGN